VTGFGIAKTNNCRENYMQRITDDLKQKKMLVSDGAWGTFLQMKGLMPGMCPEEWNISHRQDVLDIAKSYIACGADMIETNSFGGSRIRLGHYGLGDSTKQINEAAARISREAAGVDKHVIASIGPTGALLMMGETSEAELYDSFAEQAIALEAGGADACCIETMSAIDEAVIAVKAVKENTKLEVLATFTFEKKAGVYRTMMGVSPRDMTAALREAGADIIGTNCGNGIELMIDIVKEIRSADATIPVIVQANAGLPVLSEGTISYADTPQFMASFVPALVNAGANIIGGCCGTTPAHIQAIKQAFATYLNK
jgi:5-methyltetrahydrofolate--homocysteine methyltransferase